MTMITPSYLGETIEYSSLHACRSTLEDPTRKQPRNTLLRKLRKCAHAAADDEESRAHLVPVQQIEQFGRDSRIRAVVEGKRYCG